MPTDTQYSWVNVDEAAELEGRLQPAPSPSANAASAAARELEQRLREQQAELEQLRLESAQRIRVAESERDAALAAVEELRAGLGPAPIDVFAKTSFAPPIAPTSVPAPLATQPPPLPSRAPVVSQPHGLGLPPPTPSPQTPSPQRPSPQTPSPKRPAPPPEVPSQSRRRERGSVPTLSEVLVATDPLGHDLGTVEPDERRSEPRISKQFEIEFNYETQFFAGLTLDISSGGLFIATYQLLPVGTALSLSFQLPDEVRLSVRGEVRWVRCASEGHERPGMGVAFKELSAEALVAISDFCAERPPLYIDL